MKKSNTFNMRQKAVSILHSSSNRILRRKIKIPKKMLAAIFTGMVVAVVYAHFPNANAYIYHKLTNISDLLFNKAQLKTTKVASKQLSLKHFSLGFFSAIVLMAGFIVMKVDFDFPTPIIKEASLIDNQEYGFVHLVKILRDFSIVNLSYAPFAIFL